MSNTAKDYFDVCIKVLQCCGLSTQIKDVSQVCVKVGSEIRYSKVIQHSIKPFFDDYFVFTKFSNLSEFMDTLIVISAFHRRKHLKVRKLIGCIRMDVATVWNRPERHLKKWFLLSSPRGHLVQGKVFVECDLKIMTSGEYHQLYQLSNFESSEVIGSKRARYKVLFYHGVGLRTHGTNKDQTVSIKVSFSGKTKSTSLKKLEDVVTWNEQIGFIELFPPMRQKLTLEMKQARKVVAVRSINIIEFFKIFHSGFLKMFGPTYIHLYTEHNLYRGSVLISLESEILGQLREFEHADGISLISIEPTKQSSYGTIKQFLCFGIIFELVITKENCDKDDIYLSLEMGSCKIETQRYSASQYDNILLVPFDKEKPCVSLVSEWPDCSHRLYNSNVLADLANDIREHLHISNVMRSKGCEEEARNSLISACHTFKNKYRKAVHCLMNGITELDRKHTMFLKRQILALANVLIGDITFDNVKEKCDFFLSVHSNCSEDKQDSLPLLRIILHQGKTVIGSCVLHPKDIIFSEVEERKGIDSGKVNYLFFKGKDEEVVAKVDIWLWLGKEEEIDKCQELFPPGYKSYSLPGVDYATLPSSLSYCSSHLYQVICHIHSGFIHEEAVSKGECDPVVKVCFLNQCQQTMIAKQTLAPIWKETLILPVIKLYRSPEYLMRNPPPITIQLWNEATNPPQLIGHGLIDSNVKLQTVSDITEFPLKWWMVGKTCEVLVSCQIFVIAPEDVSEESFSICKDDNVFLRYLEPPTVSHRLEIVFWGIRPTYARTVKTMVQPQVIVQLHSARISSDVIPRVNTTFNFARDTRIACLNLPRDRLLSPPLIIKIMSNLKYLVTLTEKNIYRYEHQLPKKCQWDLISARRSTDKTAVTSSLNQVTFPDIVPLAGVSNHRLSSFGALLEIPNKIRHIMSDFSLFSKYYSYSSDEDVSADEGNDELDQDWWDRYWNNEMKIYNNSLEEQKEFSGFTDALSTFPIKIRKDNTRKHVEIGKLKAIISLYKWPADEPVVTIQRQDPEMGILKLYELNSRVNILVRVYCVNAFDLYPSDLNGKSDPYIEIATPTKTVSDQFNKLQAELNPVFGNYLEIVATLPVDSLLAVRVMDWDTVSADDLIGETIIDIENRFYSKHRATCGLPESYDTSGPNTWRDIETPKDILERLCNAHNLPLPQYNDKSVKIGSKVFFINKTSFDKTDNNDNDCDNQQKLALEVLNHWEEMPIVGRHLVEEHVETRLLFREDRPGLVRGRLKMWVDMFDTSLGNIPLPIDITPRMPQAYELRVHILNTAKIPLIDEFAFRDKKCTDILVTAGWLGDQKNTQKTDVHYKSHTGEGNFNWRFVFPFRYYRREKKIVFHRKNPFDIGTTEEKVSPILHLKVYDGEGLMEDSFIGGMLLDLCRMPRGAPTVKDCKIEKILDRSKFIDLFKVYSLKGWWPFLLNSTVLEDRGFLEAEFFLITAEEARKCPVGLGRSPPEPLPIPARVTSRRTPWQMIEETLSSHNYQAYCGLTLNFFIVLIVVVLIGVMVYTLPSMVEKYIKPLFRETH